MLYYIESHEVEGSCADERGRCKLKSCSCIRDAALVCSPTPIAQYDSGETHLSSMFCVCIHLDCSLAMRVIEERGTGYAGINRGSGIIARAKINFPVVKLPERLWDGRPVSSQCVDRDDHRNKFSIGLFVDWTIISGVMAREHR